MISPWIEDTQSRLLQCMVAAPAAASRALAELEGDMFKPLCPHFLKGALLDRALGECRP